MPLFCVALCAVAVFSFSKADSKVNASAAASSNEISFSVSNVLRFKKSDGDLQTISYSTFVGGTNNNISTSQTDNSITLQGDELNFDFEAGYVAIKSEVTVPARKEYVFDLSFNLNITKYSATDTSSTAAKAEFFYFGDSDKSSEITFATHATPGVQSSTYSKLLADLLRNETGAPSGVNVDAGPYEIREVTYTNDTDSPKTFNSYFGMFADIGYANYISNRFKATCRFSNQLTVNLLPIPSPQDITVTYDGNSKWISDLTTSETPAWLNLDIYNNAAYMSVDSISYQDNMNNAPATVTVGDVKNAGVYTVTMKLADGLEWADGTNDDKSFKITINKKKSTPQPKIDPPQTTTPYVSAGLPTLVPNGGTPGTFEWKQGEVATAGTNRYNWTFTPTDKNNFTVESGEMELTYLARELSSITVTGYNPTATVYTNTSISVIKSYLTVEATYTDNTTETLTSFNVEVDSIDGKLQTGTNTLVITTNDGSQTTTCDISGVVEVSVSSITLVKLKTGSTFKYPVTADEIKAAIERVNVQWNTGSSSDYDISDLSVLTVGGTLNAGIAVTVTIGISGTTATKDINIKIDKGDFDVSGITFTGDTVTYDGSAHTIAIAGTLPSTDISVVYGVTGQTATEFVNAGTYDYTVSFTHSNANYNAISTTLTATLTIEKADYPDADKIKFEGASVSVGTTVTAEAENVPDGVTVTYVYNGTEQSDPFEFTELNETGYSVTAKFAHDDPNYNDIADKTATLKITTASAEMSVTFEDKTETYDGENHTLVLGGDLPAWATVEYYLGETEFTGAVDAGTYEITAKFTVDLSLYEQPADMTATLKISPADYDMTGVTFESATVAYDGEAHSIFVGGIELPEWITVTYEGNGITEIGAHTVTAKFSHTNGNYGSIGDMTAQITISKAKIAVPVYNNSLSYTGASVTPTGANFTGFDAEIMTLVAGKTVSGLSAGSYKAVIKLNDPTKYEWAASALKKSLFAVALFDEEIALAAGETAVDWSLAKAKITATPKAELAAGSLPEFASESYIGELGEVLTLKYYTDKECKQEIAADELGYETTYYVKVALLDNDNFELETSAMEYSLSSVAYTTPAKELTFWEKVVVFLKTNWLWLVIAAVALILLITIIACCARASKKKKARLEKEEQRRIEKEEREREERRLEREERMARLSQQQSAPAPQYIPQPMPQFAPQMPMQSMSGGGMSGGNGGGSVSEAQFMQMQAELATLKASQESALRAEVMRAEQAAMKAEQSAKESAMRAEQNAVLRSDVNALRGGDQQIVANGMTAATLAEIVTAAVKSALAGDTKPAQQTNGDGTQVPPDAVMTTVTTTKIDTTKKTAQNGQEFDRDRNRSTRSFVAPMPVDDGRVFDVGGFYKPADPSDLVDPDEEGK